MGKIVLPFRFTITSIRSYPGFWDGKTGIRQVGRVPLGTAWRVQAAPVQVEHGDYMITPGRLPQNENLAVFCVSHSKITRLG